MVFFLASMPSPAYDIYCSLVHMYENDSKKSASKLDCKGFKFKGLRGLDQNSVLNVLNKVKDGSLKLNNINNHCYQLKVLEKVKTSFIKLVGAENWEDARKIHPEYASEHKLISLFVPNFNADSMSFIDYCRRAVK